MSGRMSRSASVNPGAGLKLRVARRAGNLAMKIANAFNHVVRRLNERCPVTGSAGCIPERAIDRRARHRHDFAAGRGVAGRSAIRISGLLRRQRFPPRDRHNPVPIREVARLRLGSGRHLGDQQPAFRDIPLPSLIFRR